VLAILNLDGLRQLRRLCYYSHFEIAGQRSDLRANPDKFYVFGDNVQRTGFGGQAAYMRGEPNAIGLATKWSPSMSPHAFFDDTLDCKSVVERDLMQVQRLLDDGKTVVVPADGIGTGLSQLPKRDPHLHDFITNWFKKRAALDV
jgi:hypothetical protein